MKKAQQFLPSPATEEVLSCFLILIYRGTIKFTMTSNISEVWKHHRGSAISWEFQWWKSCRPADVIMQEKAKRTIKLYSLPTARPLIHYVMLSNERLCASLIRYIYTLPLKYSQLCLWGFHQDAPYTRWVEAGRQTHTQRTVSVVYWGPYLLGPCSSVFRYKDLSHRES